MKNEDGHLGPICDQCGGYGFTFVLTGGSSGCHHCNQTGIKTPSNRELQEQIVALQQQLSELRHEA